MKIQHDTTPPFGFVSLDIRMDSRIRLGLNALVGPTSHFQDWSSRTVMVLLMVIGKFACDYPKYRTKVSAYADITLGVF